MSAPPSGVVMRVVVLVSGSGTNLQALLDDVHEGDGHERDGHESDGHESGGDYEVVAVGADRPGTGGEARARAHGIPTFVVSVGDFASREDWDGELTRQVAKHAPDLVVSAGFMKVLGPLFLARHRTINTHPALLPSFPGTHGVRDALTHGVKVTGCTCHWVDAGVDTGRIIDQRAVRVEPADDEASLHERIKQAERAMLVEVVRGLAAERGAWRERAADDRGGTAERH
jgi:phosphoribosylglycinamide formyltransferase 1